ncbi:MAG TPA: hypothetical protein VFG50_13200 [Rhodothermales bacterium]|nr:hypothetical protein [Rhodothermales bacterium]
MEFRTTTYIEATGTVEIISPAVSAVPGKLEAEQHQLIVEHWESFAAAAYEGFRRFGAGAVVIEENKNHSEEIRHPFLRHMIWYAAGLDAWIGRENLQDAVKYLDVHLDAYDPSDACVFVFLREKAPTRVYLARGPVSPAQALTRIKSLLN